MSYKTELVAKLDSLQDDVKTDVANGLTDFLRDQVSAGMHEVQDTVMDRITSMRLRAEFTFPDHALY